jgi:hypothetical protein
MQELPSQPGHVPGRRSTKTLRERVAKDLSPQVDNKRKLESADWETLSLVDVQEVETHMNHVRLGQLISHECEWQLRDLAAYMGSLLSLGRADDERNPLRPEILGAALNRGHRGALGRSRPSSHLHRELGQMVAQAMPECYTQIIKMLQERGIQPVHLTVRTVEGPGQPDVRVNSAYQSLPARRVATRRAAATASSTRLRARATSICSPPHRRALARPRSPPAASPTACATRCPPPRVTGGRGAAVPQGRGSAAADQQLMTLLRR